MSDDHLFPKFMCKVSKSRGVPHVAIIIMACVTIVLCKFDFTTLIMATTPLQLYIYMALSICIIRLRKMYPVEERREQGLYVMIGGKTGLYLMTIMPFVISLVALYVNGTDYFIAGFVLMAVSLILYLICKWAYKGCVIDDPDAYPLNPRTRLSLGDTINIGVYVFLSGLAAFLGSILLTWYEGADGPAYYLEEYGHGFFSNFSLMINTCRWGGLILLIAGICMWVIGKKTEGPALVEVKKKRKIRMDKMKARVHGLDK